MVYLLIVSIFFHFVTFFTLIILYKRQEPTQSGNNQQSMKEMEDMLLSYTTEMKENNERLIRRLKEEKSQLIKQQAMNIYETSPEVLTAKEGADKDKSTDTSAVKVKAYEDYEPPVPSETSPEEKVEASKHSRVLALNQEGYSEKEIARRLNIGAGEVELLLKFS